MKQSLLLWKRAFLLWWKMDPRLFLSVGAMLLFQNLTPFLTIYFTARLLGEITGPCRGEVLFKLTACILLLAAVLSLAGSLFARWKNTVHAGYWKRQEEFFTRKLLQMDFEAVDDPQTHELLAKIQQGHQFGSWGLYRIAGQFEDLLGSLIRILGSILLCISLFTQKVPLGNSLAFLNHPLFLFALIAGLLMMTILPPRLTSKANSFWASFAGTSAQENRIYMFNFHVATSRERAMDVRIYRQNILSSRILADAGSFCPGSPLDKYWHGPGGGYYALSAALSWIFTGLVYGYVCMKAWAGAFGIGAVSQYVSAITALSAGVSSLLARLGDIRNNAPFLETTFSFLDIPNKMYQGSISVEKRSDRQYDVEFRDVSFRYPHARNWALRHVSMKFRIGERLAVVGENGSGKTTMIKLLCRLYDPTEGEILLNGIDIRKYRYEEYLDLFSVVFQDFQLLAYGLGSNVAGSAVYDPGKAADCLADAGLNPRLAQLPKGLDTCLGREFEEDGVEFSGGETQKIAIARALYKNAPFIVLDEPTAALDPIAEAEIYSRFDTLIQDKTAIYISHRLSSCRFCDKIAVFDRGSIVQYGSHDELVTLKEGKYHALWQAQAQYYQS